MPDNGKPDIEEIARVFDWSWLVLAFALGALAVAIAVEFLHRSLPEHSDDAA